ncbi:hypothetical protein EHM76_07040, partial [bacterium]
MESRINYAVLAVIMPVLIILQYALAAGFFNPDINMALLLTVTIAIVLIKSSEIAYLAIKTPPPPRPKYLYFFTGGI